MKPAVVRRQAQHILALAELVAMRAEASTPQQRRARTLAINRLAAAARRLSANNRSPLEKSNGTD